MRYNMAEEENGKSSDHPTHNDQEEDFKDSAATIHLKGSKNFVRKDESSDSLGRLSPITTGSRRNTHHGSSNKNKKSTKKKRIVPGEAAFDVMIEQAEFEARHDPYRGIGLMLDESKRGERHPWKICQFGSSLTAAAAAADNEADVSDEEEAFDYGQNLVQSVCQCNCPSLIRWANEANDKRNRTRKRKRKKASSTSDESTPAFAGRPEQGDVRCVCDYNPFCLATCGGAMNEALTKRLLDFSSEEQHSDRGTDGDHDGDGDEVLVLDKEGNRNILYDPTNPKSLYSKATRKKLNSLRKDLYVDIVPIRSYLKGVLEDMTAAVPISECLRLVQKWHQSLIFVNPLVDNENDEKKRMRLSVPPGIENLGATCYLNTQLQCLAQNLIFSQGIFSWRPPSTTSVNNSEDRMTSVIRLFQQLLLRMNSGPSAVLNTLEFSNALGLDHYEQQDPNEFSRLFFDRLHDSFQRISSTEEDGNGLKELLPHLFEGISAYETTCLSCSATSTRKELFMDMNLPIVDPIDKQKKKPGQQKLEEVYAPKMDVTVQDCLNSYCSAEILEGDNQYFCSACNSKQDAKRALSFEKLPPVLNVQLSRYVFDRATLMKKKLGNKVLLPLELSVQGKDRVRKAGHVEHRYLLAAVMRHQGTSAYSGHYVAEAMDWMTGQWFEFNDEKVSFLGKGPSCSFDPTKKLKGSPPAGSKDAYNMYYVEESFLAQSVVEAIRAQTRASPDNGTITVESISIERSAEYSDVAQMCLDDIKVWNQLDRRRLKILDSIIPSLFSRQATQMEDYIWVDGDELRQFLSCKKVLNLDQSTSDDLPLQYRRFRCSHPNQGIHPRLARRGKLISSKAYDAYLSLLRQELGSDWTPDDRMTPCDVYCGECCVDYRQELSHKIDRAQTLTRLYNALDPKEDTFSLHIGALEVLDDESDKYAFIVSRKFITWFRHQVERIMKPAMAIEDTKKRSDITAEKSICESIVEGLDAMDISLLAKVKASTEAEFESDDSEKVVNESISCEHGKCVVTSKRNIRHVPWSVWRDIEAIFPKSIEHRRSRIGYQEVEEIDNDENVCRICTRRKNSASAKREKLLELLNSLEKITRRKVLTHDSTVEKEVEAEAGFLETYRVLHNDDVEAWKKFISRAKRKLSGKETGLDDETQDSLLPSRKWNISIIQAFRPDADDTIGAASFLSKVIRPIICTKHNLPIAAALFRHFPKGSSQRILNDRLCILKESEYRTMFSTLSTLVCEILDSESGTAQLYDVECDSPAGVEWCHPSFVRNEGCNSRSDPSHLFAIQSKKMSMYFRLESCVCDDETCNESFSKWRNAEDAAWTEPKSDSDNVSARDSTQALGSAASDPIPVDSDDNAGTSDRSTLFSAKVFEAKKGASVDSILNGLSVSPEPSPKDTSLQRFLRRSTRQRKTRYPSGVILAEDSINIDLKSNIAALRLLLLEQISNGETFELSHTLRLVVRLPVDDQFSASSASPVVVDVSQPAALTATSSSNVIDLPLDKSAVILEDVLRSSLDSEKEMNLRSLDVVIVRQSEEDPNAKDIPKDAMMDYMIGLSNTAEIEDSRPQKRRKTRVERGFTGTFLASRSESENDTDKVEKDSNGTTNSDREQTTRVSGQMDSSDGAEIDSVNRSSENVGNVKMADAYDCKLHKGNDMELVHTKSVDGRRDSVAHFATKTDTSCDVEITDATQLERSGHDIVDDSRKTGHGTQETCHPGKLNYIAELQIDTAERLHDAPDPFPTPTSPKFGSSKENAIDWEHQPAPSVIGRNVNNIDSSAQKESSSHRILMLVQLLLRNPDVRNSDESRCYDAASWAIQNDPTMQDDLLLQHAYAKYLDLCQAGT